ncbi:MAG: ImmA/IrrE family metallo-endopeptidase [Candidatus Hydrogenedentes bacterium]|nr:ImmA/IrrE family metallo-endopeptidase [Candidatus Hydrogenedentota bacterium]
MPESYPPPLPTDLFQDTVKPSAPEKEPAEGVRKSLDDLVARALAYRTGPELKKLLEFTTKFPHIAPYNAMLLHVQNPGIRYALRAKDWFELYQRQIRPAARPYVILRTMGPVDFVFDLSDTDPVDPEFDNVPESIRNPFRAKGAPSPGVLGNLTFCCSLVGVQVEQRDFATHLAGRVQRLSKSPFDFHIALNNKHTEAQKIGTLAHEVAHIFCGHLGQTKDGFWPKRPPLTIEAREFEAEVVAYMVTSRMNLDIGSVEYLSGYLGADKTLPVYSLDAVLKAVGKIEEMLQGRFRLKKKTEGARATSPPIAPPRRAG